MRSALPFLLLAAVAAGCADEPEPGRTVVLAMDEPTPRFVPPAVEVAVGDPVEFRVESGRHSVDFAASVGPSATSSGDLTRQQPFAVRFSAPGTYHYSCAYHTGMSGTVTVRA